MFNQGKVRTSKLEGRINNLMPLAWKISCWSKKDTFNEEIQQQWREHQNDILAEEFAQDWNFLCNLQGPNKIGEHGKPRTWKTSVMPTKTSMTLKTSRRMTLTLKMNNLNHRHE
jgi:hypothetical protein